MPVTPLTDALMGRMAALRIAPEHPASIGIRNALGVWPGDVPSNETYPIIGFHISANTDPADLNITCYMVGVGQFIRYEWTPAASLTFACGIDRVSSVSERIATDPENPRSSLMTVTVELDAQGVTHQLQSESRQGGNGEMVTVAAARTERSNYVLSAADAPNQLMLSSFSLGLRTAMAG